MPRVIVLGEALIDLFAGTGMSLQTTRAFLPAPGGAPANVAVAVGVAVRVGVLLALQVALSRKPLHTLSFDEWYAIIRFANGCGALTTT